MDIKKFSSYSVYTSDNKKNNVKYKNNILINNNEINYLLNNKNQNFNDYLNERFEKKRKNKIDISKVTGESTNKYNLEINENCYGFNTNYEKDFDKYGKNYNLLLNNGFNIINDNKKDNYLKKQFDDNIITSKKNQNNNIINKYSEFTNKYKNDPFSILPNYRL